jgi:hypothetical protein
MGLKAAFKGPIIQLTLIRAKGVPELKRAEKHVLAIDPGRLDHAKFAYATRRVPPDAIATLLPSERNLAAGDLVLARVTKIGQHEHVELPNGRRAMIYEGDEIILCFGNRYAPDQFEAFVPDRLGPCQLVAAGGLAATVVHRHVRMREATDLTALGLLGDTRGRRLNLLQFGLPPDRPDPSAPHPPLIAVAGTSMNSGKTTVMACLTRGLIALGGRVAAAKITGTGAGGDHWHMADAGADPAVDFIDAGRVSTYRLPGPELDQVVWTQLAHMFRSGADFVLAEFSDGLLEAETDRLLTSPALRPFISAVVFTAGEAMGAAGGVAWLRAHGLPVVAVSGVLTSSPLAMREALGAAEVPVHASQSLVRPEIAAEILKCAVPAAALPLRGKVPGPSPGARKGSVRP